MNPKRIVLSATFVCAALAACASPPRVPVVEWRAHVVHEGKAFIERIRPGRADPSFAGPQVVVVDQAGDVALVQFGAPGADGAPRAASRVIHQHGAELTGLVIADVDPAVPGDEIYVGGDPASGSGAKGGEIVQIVIGSDGAVRARRVVTATGYVHSIESAPAGRPPALYFTTYTGEVRVAEPVAGEGEWPSRLLFQDEPEKEPEARKMKDATFLAVPGGGARHELLAVAKTGRTFLIDVDRPGSGRLVHSEPGGLSRAEADNSGGAYVCGYHGRAMHFERDGDGFRVVPLDHEGKESGLRGFVPGRFPVTGGVGEFAVFGYHARCRVLVPRLGEWDATTIHVDPAKGHTLLPLDVVPGNDADEIVLGGQSMQVTVLVAR